MVLVYFQGNILNEGYIHSDLLRLTFFAHNLFIFISRYFFNYIVHHFFNCVSHIWFSCFSHIILLFGSFSLKWVLQSSWRNSSLPFCFFCGFIISLLALIFTTLLTCVVFCYVYTVQFSDYLWQLSICSRISSFVACIYFISYLYISTVSFILLMVISCAAH